MDDTPLHKASTPEEVNNLLSRGWRVDAPGWMGATPLHAAAERGLPDVARVLIGRGANVNAGRPERHDTPLHFARNAAVARVLIEAGADIEALDWSGRTPLHWAAQFGRADVARALLDAGAGVDRQATDGATPLHWAAQEGQVEVVELLLRADADAHRPDVNGRTPLHRAAWRGSTEVAEILLAAGADPKTRSGCGQTPLHEAKANGHKTLAKRLGAARGSGRTGGQTIRTPAKPTSLGLRRVRIHPDRPEAVTIGENAILQRWTLGEPATVVLARQAEHAWFSDLAADPQGEFFAVATPEPTIEIRRWDDLRMVAALSCRMEPGHGAWPSLDWSPDGRWLAVADSREQVHLIDRTTGTIAATADAGERTDCVRFDPTSRLLAVACSFQGGGSVQIYRIEDGQLLPLAELERSSHRTRAKRFVDTLVHLDFHPDGASLALFETSAIGQDARPRGWVGSVVLFDAPSWTPHWTASVDAKATGDKRLLSQLGYGMGYNTEVLFVGPDTLACGTPGGLVLFYRLPDGKLIRKVRVHPDASVVSLGLERSSGAIWAALGKGGGVLARIPR